MQTKKAELTIDGQVAQGAGALRAELLQQPDLLVAAAVAQLQALRRHHRTIHNRLQAVALNNLKLVGVCLTRIDRQPVCCQECA